MFEEEEHCLEILAFKALCVHLFERSQVDFHKLLGLVGNRKVSAVVKVVLRAFIR